MKYNYKTKGICAREIIIELNDNIIKSVEFIGGCNGNTKGLSSIVKGMNIDDVIDKLKGITCNSKSTSCPDQLAHALEEIKEKVHIN